MSSPAGSRKLLYVTIGIIPVRSLLLALFLVSGILGGYALSARCAAGTEEEIGRWLNAYLSSAALRTPSAETMLRTAACYLRAPVLAFLFGFSALGVAALPILCAAQGFVLSFSLFSFAAVLGRQGFVLLPALFALRLLFVLPCTMLLASDALDKSRSLALLSLGGGKRARPVVFGTAYWYRFAACCVCLIIGCALELWLVPVFLGAR